MKQKMFALKWDSHRGSMVTCVSHQASWVRERVGQHWFESDWREGWKRAKKHGARVVPVWVSLNP